jgi:hypothetical protein
MDDLGDISIYAEQHVLPRKLDVSMINASFRSIDSTELYSERYRVMVEM